MATDKVNYLNDGNPPAFFSRMLQLIEQGKQARAPAAQWISTIQAFSQKGVKQSELDESGAITYLKGLTAAQAMTKEELVDQIKRRYFTVKEVLLGSPKYPGYRQPGGNDYREYLYIANSERDNVKDALDDVNFEMEELAFDPELAVTQPERILSLEARREALMTKVGKAIEFTSHHFSDKIEGRYGKNLLAHCRVSVHEDTYFIDEIQSDWAQRGRKVNWNGIAKGPLVTNTEAWAGMVLRRQMQIAASMPGIKRLAWITESMRNGGRQNPQAEAGKEASRKAYREFIMQEMEEKLQAIGAQNMTPDQLAEARKLMEHAARAAASAKGLYEPTDMLNDFYLMVLPKLADRTLSKAGVKTSMQSFVLDTVASRGAYGQGVHNEPNLINVPSIEMTPAVKDLLVASQPMYSRAPLRMGPITPDAYSKAVAQAMERTQEMLGTVRHLRFAKHVYDVATGHKVAGRYINNLIQVSLSAADILGATEHECFHFAADNLFTASEVEMVRTEFSPGTFLNARVQQVLRCKGMHRAADQCTDPMDAAAHGFTLWTSGDMDIPSPRAKGLFSDLVNLAHDCVCWFKRTVMEQRCTSVEELFEALSRGDLAAHRQHNQQHSSEADDSPESLESPESPFAQHMEIGVERSQRAAG